jgi:hypothetical protein
VEVFGSLIRPRDSIADQAQLVQDAIQS